jgi:hypothetical protein
MSLQIYGDSDGGFRLHRQDRQVGWVEGKSVGFRGFGSGDEALSAANAAYDALRAWLARERRIAQLPGRRRALQVRREGSQTTIALAGVAIGRIITYGADARTGESEFGFELTLPPQVGTVAGISAAQVIHNAIRTYMAATRREPQAPESLEAAAGA